MKNVIRSTAVLLLYLIYGEAVAQFNYGEALQKSLFFYEAQQSGELPSWNRVPWRGDSAMEDGSDVGLDLTGGWYDAGDHVKFNFPMAYTVTTLAWGGIEFEDAYRRSGQLDILKRNLRFVTDYFLKCHTGPQELWGQVAAGGIDHAWWGPAEVNPQPRESFKLSGQNGGSDLAGETAAALAAVSILLKDDDPAYSARLLESAEELYAYADDVRKAYSESITDAAGFYRSFSNFEDEIVWGAAWLYRATNNSSYLAKAEAEYDNMQREGQSSTAKYTEAFSWDDKAYGAYVLMSILTGDDKYKQDAERNLDWWTGVGVNGEEVPKTPGGLPHIRQWGTLRYANNEAFLALVYSDKVSTDAAQQTAYRNYAKFMADYTLGDNPINRSFMIGCGNNPANKPHHRGAHGGWTNNCSGVPDTSSHILYGAVVGGPKSPTNDDFVDDRCEFIANEVACDYNAGITGVLAYMYGRFGGDPLAVFPPASAGIPSRAETRTVSKFNSNNASGSTIQIRVQNRTAWPARVTDKLSYRYFFDISEGVAQGLTIADYEPTLNAVQSSASITIGTWDASRNIYYAEVSLAGEEIAPIGDPQFRRETQLNFRVSNGVPYDTTNDWSAQSLGGSLEETSNIPVYDNGVLVFGAEPDGGNTPVASFTASATTGIAPVTINFDGLGSSDPNGDSLNYNWDFGNGETSTNISPSATYTAPGSYLVTLTVDDGVNTSTPATETITITDGSPIAEITASVSSGIAPLQVSFDASASVDPTGGDLTYSWDLGNGTTSTSATPTATYTDIGEVTVTLTVTNAAGETNVDTETITVIDGNIDCSFGAPLATALPTINTAFENIFVLGENGPNLDNVSNLTINWDLSNNGLYQFSMNTTNGNPSYFVDFLPLVSQNFNAAQPEISISGSGFTGLDGEYFVGIESGDFALVSKTGGYTIFFSKSSTEPNCGSSSTPVAVNGGTISGGPFAFIVGDGVVDNVSGVTLTGTEGETSQWIITDDQGVILGLPASPEAVNFDGAGPGSCFIYNVTYNGTITGLTANENIADLGGDFDLSNSIEVVRNAIVTPPAVDGGTISGGPFTFTVGDGVVDNVSGVTITGTIGATDQWIVTDDQGVILGLPASPEAVDFDGAGPGSCFIYNVTYNGAITGLTANENIANLGGDFDLSNRIEVIRNEVVVTPPAVDGGTISGGPFTFTVGDGVIDNVSGVTLTGTVGATNQWIVTDDQGVILGLPASPEAVDFDGAGPGSCFIYNVTYNGAITGLTANENIANLGGDFDLSNSIEVIRNEVVSDDSDCTFDTPLATALPSINTSFENIYVLGTNGPNFDNVTNFVINWDLSNNGLYQLSMNTNNGTPDWFNNFLPNTTQNFASTAPSITITNSGFTGFDGEYYATIDNDNFVLVSKTGDFTIYFSKSTDAPTCGDEDQDTNTNPIANISATPISGQAPLEVNFDASGSTDADGDALTYSWDFADGNTSSTIDPENTYTSAGVYEVTLTVTDANGAVDQAKININVSDDPIVITPPSADNEYINRFIELRNEIYDPANGYFSADGSPHHSIESLIVEAPDHGHESTSELYSYWLWLEVMNGRITGDWAPLRNVWEKTEQFIIPTRADQPSNGAYDPSSPAAYASEFPLPSDYPAPLDLNAPVGIDPVSPDLTATYGADIYQMHWLLDNDNFYGYGNRGDGVSTPSYINTFQRGEEESVYETVPHPSWEAFNWGGPDGFLPIFIQDQNYSRQWRYTSAPDADARAVQAMYWAQEYVKEQGASLGNLDLDKASKMGDFLRLAMFDKYFKPLGVQSPTSGAGTGYDSAHYLMSWYMSWGGSANPASQWAFRISSSHCHFGYQNPMAAYALTQVDELKPISQNGERDWNVSLKRQMEFYTWLQSKEGAIAGGATNSWNGDYSTYPSGKSTFYDMAFDKDPVYHDPGSGTWFGWQAWSMERVAEYYYITNDPMAKNLMDKWSAWVKSEVRLIGDDDFEIPATLEWTGEPDTWDPANPGTNQNLSVQVTDYSRDLGVAGSMAKALIYYAAATQKYATLDVESRDLAKEVLDRMWNTYRDDKGVSAPESRGDFSRIFEEEVYIPDGFTGQMPNGDVIEPGVTFLDIRSNLRNDPDFPALQAAYDSGTEYTQRYHRSWAQMEVALANAEYGFFFGEDNNSSTTARISSNVVELDNGFVSVSPNPASSFVNVSVANNSAFNANNESLNVEINIINIAGTIVHTENVESMDTVQVQISVEDLPSGLYILQINNKLTGKTTIEKVLVN